MVDACVRLKVKATVTDEPAYWKLPSSINKVQPEVGHQINFISAAVTRRSLDRQIDEGVLPNSWARNSCHQLGNQTRGDSKAGIHCPNSTPIDKCKPVFFFVNLAFPQVGASPDAIVTCTCCGKGCVEVKCPAKYKDCTILQACSSDDRNFCLHVVDGQVHLKKNHQYYTQVHTQLFVTECSYCDFVVWTLKDTVILRIAPDSAFWNARLQKAQDLFVKVALPELAVQYFTTPPTSQPSSGHSVLRELQQPQPQQVGGKRPRKKPAKKAAKRIKAVWCLCAGPEEDNENCPVQWYHFSCVGLVDRPSADTPWFCPSCSELCNDISLKGEDTFELHALQSELEAVEEQIHDLLVRQAELIDRRLALETSRADAHKSVISVNNPLTPTSSTPCISQHWSRTQRSRSAMVSFTSAPTRHHEAWMVPQRKMRVRSRPRRLSPTLPVFKISTQNCFSRLCETERDAVIIGDSIVRHVHATLGKSKVHSHCFPAARVSEIAAHVPEILNGDKRVGTVVLHAGVNDIRLRQTEVLKKDFRNLIDTKTSSRYKSEVLIRSVPKTGRKQMSVKRKILSHPSASLYPSAQLIQPLFGPSSPRRSASPKEHLEEALAFSIERTHVRVVTAGLCN
ncbi:unnamed protein product [Leuciscus chuanchicus]